MSFIETHDVVGMTCDHCARAVRAEVSAIEGVTDVDVDLTRGVVRVTAEQPVPDHGAPGRGRGGRLHAGLTPSPAPRWVTPTPALTGARLQLHSPNHPHAPARAITRNRDPGHLTGARPAPALLAS